MPTRDPFKFENMRRGLPNLNKQFSNSQRPPFIRFTQGGSTRPNQPAKVAATDGAWRPATRKWR